MVIPLFTLRDIVLDTWRSEVGAELNGPALRLLNRAIDLVTAAASERCAVRSRMNQLISDLLDVASIESGRLAIAAVPQDPLALVEEVVDLFAPQAASRGLTLVKEAPGELPLIRGDHHRLLQVLSNLVSNALKVTAAGSVTVRAARRDAEVEFAVIDTGPGVPEAVRSSIFEPYWRSENALYKGTGLGLAISRGIVEGHGGRIWIESTPGRGAAFLFSIPTA